MNKKGDWFGSGGFPLSWKKGIHQHSLARAHTHADTVAHTHTHADRHTKPVIMIARAGWLVCVAVPVCLRVGECVRGTAVRQSQADGSVFRVSVCVCLSVFVCVCVCVCVQVVSV